MPSYILLAVGIASCSFEHMYYHYHIRPLNINPPPIVFMYTYELKGIS